MPRSTPQPVLRAQSAEPVAKDRRGFLSACAAALALAGTGAIPSVARAAAPVPSRPASRLDALVSAIPPDLAIVNAHTGERVAGRFFAEAGYDRAVLDRIDWIMRDWRQDSSARMDVRCLWALAALRHAAMQDGFDGEIRLHSGYRTKATNDLLRRQGYRAARNSFHLRARAIDFSFPGVSVAALADYARWLEVGGVGHYPGRFIHLDSGDRRVWTG